MARSNAKSRKRDREACKREGHEWIGDNPSRGCGRCGRGTPQEKGRRRNQRLIELEEQVGLLSDRVARLEQLLEAE